MEGRPPDAHAVVLVAEERGKAGWTAYRPPAKILKLAMPKLDDRTREDVALYSTDDLRRCYQAETGEPIRLRDSILTRAELKAEILRRVWRERLTFRAAVISAAAAIISAAAAIVAAVEGWR